MKTKIILMLGILVLVVISIIVIVSADWGPEVTDPHGATHPSSGSYNRQLGGAFLTKDDVLLLTNVTEDSKSTATTAYLYYANNSLLATSTTIIGNYFVFNTELAANSLYFIETGSGTSSYTQTWGAISFDTGTNVDWKWGTRVSGTINTSQVQNILSITTKVYQEPTDTCTYTSGTWAVNCADNCAITSEVDLGGNDITITGYGTFSTTADIINYGDLIITGVDSTHRCEVMCAGGCFKT